MSTPSKPMEVYQLVLEGFDGGTDEIDHLIKWVGVPEGYFAQTLQMLNEMFDIRNSGKIDVGVGDPGVDAVFMESFFAQHHR